MAETTGIEWADHTFNPWIGCTKVSPACDHCYAEDWSKRFNGPAWGKERRRTSAANWKQPLKWNREAAAFRSVHGRAPMVFCASLADVFDNQVPDEWRTELWELIAQTPDLIWLVLTKRPQNIRKMLPEWRNVQTTRCFDQEHIESVPSVCPNLWLGTTVENQAEADRRIPHLLSVPAAKRFLSCEPLLGPVGLRTVAYVASDRGFVDALTGQTQHSETRALHPARYPDTTRIDWVIAGGESGREARPSHPDWFRGLRDQCAAAGVPFLFKQWGEWIVSPRRNSLAVRAEGYVHPEGQKAPWPSPEGFGEYGAAELEARGFAHMSRVGKKAAGRTLDGVIHDGRPVA